ncbi:NADH-quinone oxidoreductase subunit L [Posidoniimonas polymericola]|uniref:Probable inorganic carbon transporter subunit DabB n=1 Tax=Posidoniimonas polymericola TaxID=2528002 RepID=A0A5C5YU61_9BACT|nr:proton-conducting transporter membrane subunit [Posidoniimonas polymericola]TWT78360.1 NADH-quinone oxidoreductase subunit L [Posidoniimonas polymericola]
MNTIVALLIAPVLGLLTTAFLPSSVANANVGRLRVATTTLVAAQLLLACILALAYLASAGAPLAFSVFEDLHDAPLGFSVYYDGASALMLTLVSFVGLVVSRFSVRYLDGEALQGRYFRWLGFTIGAVSLMVIAGNLLLFFAAWVMTSFGLHQLLLHYRRRESAHRAAWTKFAISRLGDVFLVSALVLTFRSFGTLELSALFDSVGQAGATQSAAVQAAIGWLLMLGAATKSAQFPFHTWLPDTMETPTPVSALMHAGIVNAGGYLMIRMSPLVASAPAALTTLALVGGFTACFAGVVMMTQPSVKRALAYSTIAQMGFMMLQCGLGAYSAAMLHIIAHSLYKAHAFLSSGSVVADSLATGGARSLTPGIARSAACFVAAGAAVAVAYLTVAETAGVHASSKPGGLVLAFLLCLALTTWGWRVLACGGARAATGGLAALSLLCLTYIGGYLVVQHFIARSSVAPLIQPGMAAAPLAIAGAFVALLALHVAVVARFRPQWLEAARVHAANGFYVDALFQRVFAAAR